MKTTAQTSAPAPIQAKTRAQSASTNSSQNSSINRSVNQHEFLPALYTAPAVFGLVLAGELLAFALVLTQSSLSNFPWETLGYVSLIVQWVVLLSTLAIAKLAHQLNKLSAVLAGFFTYTLVLFIAFLVLIASAWFSNKPLFSYELVKFMLLAAIFSGLLLRYLYLQQQLRQQQQAELQSRIQALHARIRPHFLFNAMNAVASLIAIDPDRAEEVVEDLCILFRTSLKEDHLVTLDKEVELCRHYADIESVRLDERLTVNWQCDHANCDILVPSLILQPLIENAICHGIQRIEDGGTVHIDTRCNKQGLQVTIVNPLPVLADNQTDSLTELKGNRMALQNIHNRLQAHYGKHAKMVARETQTDIDDEGAGFYKVVLSIDQHKQNTVK